MGNQQDLKQTLFNHSAAMEQALIDLGKAATILNHWTNVYSFREAPSPRAALNAGSGAAQGPHYSQSARWFYEYESIVQYIHIVFDYIHRAEKELTQALQEG